MTLSSDDRVRMTAILAEMKWLQNRCMGGEDQQGSVIASQLVGKLRLWLRDDEAFLDHIKHVVKHPAA